MHARARALCPIIVVFGLACGREAPEPTPATPAPPTLATAPTPPHERTPLRERAPAVTTEKSRAFRRALAAARRAHRAHAPNTIALYRAALALDGNGAASCELGFVLFEAGQLDDARAAITRALALLPDPPVPENAVNSVGACLYNLGRVEEAQQHTDAAKRAYERSLAVRPANRTVQARLDALRAGASIPPAAPATSGCTQGHTLAVDLTAWRARVEALRGAPEAFNPLLGEIGLEPLANDRFLDMDGNPLEAAAARAEVELHDFAIPGTRAWLVQVTVTAEENRADAVALLRAKDGGLCLLGTVEQMQDMCSTNCLEDTAPFSVSILRLVSADADALRVDTSSGACACGSERGGVSRSAFYGVASEALVTYFEAPTYHAWYESPTPPVEEVTATITLSASPPRTITVQRRITCDGGCTRAEFTRRTRAIEAARTRDPDHADALEDERYDDCGDEPSDCTPSRTTTVHTFAAGRYTPAVR